MAEIRLLLDGEVNQYWFSSTVLMRCKRQIRPTAMGKSVPPVQPLQDGGMH